MSTEANKALVRRFYEEVFNQRNIDAIDELMGTEFINNDPTPVAARDRESMKQFIKSFTKAFPDHYHAIEDLIAEGDKVVMRFRKQLRESMNLCQAMDSVFKQAAS